MVPVVSLLALWAYATVSTAQDIAQLRQVQRVDAAVREPVGAAVAALQAERTAAVGHATKPSADRAGDIKRLAATTDRAVAALRLGHGSSVADGADLPQGVADRLSTFLTDAGRLRAARTAVLAHGPSWDAVYRQYTEVIAAAFAVDGALTGVQDAEAGSDARVLLEFGRAGEMLAREDALVVSAGHAGTLDGPRLRLFTGAVDTRRELAESAAGDLHGADRARWRDLVDGSAYTDLRAAEDAALKARPGARALAEVTDADWGRAHSSVQDGMRAIETDAARAAADRASPLARGLLSPAAAAVVFGLLAVIASLVISVRIGRGLVVELVSLRNSALVIARHKLPETMRKLRAGEEIDVQAEAPLGPPAEDETGQVSEALTTVHRAALHAAVERAELASGISGVFVNLARRSQVLVHRQLGLLDSMERRADDPNELGDLFRLDHLTTRMRRHAESLIILSGAAPGRAWRMPVPLTDVVRAAVSEIEDYARVEVRQLAPAQVSGAAVADVTHLLAELVENAAQFSPPHTKVRVGGEVVGNGYAIEIEDRGLGMGPKALAEANDRIAHSEALDLFDSDRLGLFVVSRLAARQDVKVHLKTSPYGGTTAVVLLPTPLLHKDGKDGQDHTADPAQETRGTHDHARVPAPEGAAPTRHTVPAAGPRPALASVAPDLATAAETPAPREAPPVARPEAAPHPPGVTALRPRGPQDMPQDLPEDGEGLPRRVRQASLAPQLRERLDPTTPPARVPETDERTPEQVRARMTSFRDGWVRGGGRRPGSDSTEGDRT
jgi:signal transduction histidine kinase